MGDGERPTPTEEESGVTREQAIAAYREFVESDVKYPFGLDFQDPKVIEAEELLERWKNDMFANAKGDQEALLRAELVETMFYVDAGFTDSTYLDEVRAHLEEGELKAKEGSSEYEEPINPEERKTTRELYDTAKKKVEKLLASEKEN